MSTVLKPLSKNTPQKHAGGRPPSKKKKRPDVLAGFERGAPFDDMQIGKIMMYLSLVDGESLLDLAARFNCDVATVCRYKQRLEEEKTVPRTPPRPGRPSPQESPSAKSPQVEERQLKIALFLENEEAEGRTAWEFCAEDLMEELDLKVSIRTLLRDLAELGLCWRRDGYCPNTDSPEWRTKRVEFAKKVLASGIDYRSIVFTDESMIRALVPRRYRWARKGSPRTRTPRDRWAPFVHVFGFFGIGFKRLLLLPRKGTGKHGGINSADFVRALGKVLPELKEKLKGKVLVLDGASIHTSSTTKAFLAKHKFNILEGWPAHSPDLSPIENWWAELKRRCGPHLKGLTAPNDENRLLIWEAVKGAAQVTSAQMVENYVLSFRTRLEKVIELGGEYTGY